LGGKKKGERGGKEGRGELSRRILPCIRHIADPNNEGAKREKRGGRKLFEASFFPSSVLQTGIGGRRRVRGEKEKKGKKSDVFPEGYYPLSEPIPHAMDLEEGRGPTATGDEKKKERGEERLHESQDVFGPLS